MIKAEIDSGVRKANNYEENCSICMCELFENGLMEKDSKAI